MRTTALVVFALIAGLATTATRAAGEEPATRAEWLRQQRAEKSRNLHPLVQPGIEKAIVRIENVYLPRLFAPRTGFFPRAGSITNGGGFALGPGYRVYGLLGGRADLFTSAAISLKQYWIVESHLSMPRLARGRAFANVYGRYTSFPQEDFFGLGPDSSRENRADYAVSQFTTGAETGVRPRPWLSLSGGAEYFDPDMGPGKDSKFPNLDEIYDETTAPGMTTQPGFIRVNGFALVDYAHPRSARQGGRYRVGVNRYIDTASGAYTFNLFEFDLQQYLSAFNERRVLVLRAAGSFADPAGDATVPFYLTRSLGGDHTLRGFRQFRFRDRSQMLLQAEYRFEIFTAMDGALFYDTGQVAPSRRGLVLKDFERDYGFGIRIGTNLGVLVRFDVAFGSGEGTKTWLRFSHVF